MHSCNYGLRPSPCTNCILHGKSLLERLPAHAQGNLYLLRCCTTNRRTSPVLLNQGCARRCRRLSASEHNHRCCLTKMANSPARSKSPKRGCPHHPPSHSLVLVCRW